MTDFPRRAYDVKVEFPDCSRVRAYVCVRMNDGLGVVELSGYGCTQGDARRELAGLLDEVGTNLRITARLLLPPVNAMTGRVDIRVVAGIRDYGNARYVAGQRGVRLRPPGSVTTDDGSAREHDELLAAIADGMR